jgi:hypothetical protein
MRQGGGDAIKHALDVHVDHPVPVVDLQPLDRRKRHEAGVVDDRVDASVRLHGALDEALDLGVFCDVRLHGGAGA